MMEDLLKPDHTLPDLVSEQPTSMKRKAPHQETIEGELHRVDKLLLQPDYAYTAGREVELHSSGLSPAYIVIPEDLDEATSEETSLLSAVSMDDFFNLDAASGPPAGGSSRKSPN
jgi:hypothetical protein